jgi:hypothetical protein
LGRITNGERRLRRAHHDVAPEANVASANLRALAFATLTMAARAVVDAMAVATINPNVWAPATFSTGVTIAKAV